MNDGSDYIIGGRKAVPNEFPWMVRISGGCAAAYCAGSLISPRGLLSSYHCTYHSKTKNRNVPCNHSDEKRRAYIGRHRFVKKESKSYYSIPIIDVLYPEPGNQVFSFTEDRSHDLALMILKTPVTFSKTVCPICLQQRDQQFPGVQAISAGWGSDEDL